MGECVGASDGVNIKGTLGGAALRHTAPRHGQTARSWSTSQYRPPSDASLQPPP